MKTENQQPEALAGGPAHTPGPWTIHTANSTGDMEIRADNDPTNQLYCTVSVGWGQTPREVAKANARLIAASPDILIALKACVNAMRMFADLDNSKLAEEARAVIAKVEGTKFEIGDFKGQKAALDQLAVDDPMELNGRERTE